MLELKNIKYEVSDEKKEILHEINIIIPDNKLVVITGPNGGGKSTLAKIITGVATPTQGRVILNDKDITDMTVTDRAKAGMGFAFQQPVKFKGIKVFELIKIAAGREISIDSACKYLSAVGLNAGDYINREVNDSLSGGELKRIEIASVLAKKPTFSIFDEPEAGIDLWSFQNLIRVFEKMRTDINNSSIVIISHQERILKIADEIIVISDGEVSNQGSRDEIMPMLNGTKLSIKECQKSHNKE